jgi:hypothetical protein
MRKSLCLLGFLAVSLAAGCSRLAEPAQADIDQAVDWKLDQIIRRNDSSRRLYDSYKITNHYVEKRGDDRRFVYDFEAKARVTQWNYTDGGSFYKEDLQQGIVTTFNESVTLTKKGEKWYCGSTTR